MAEYIEKHLENAPGRYYVDKTCISCVSCHSIAPAFFKLKNSNEYSYVFKQPTNREEAETCEEALRECPVNAIGNDGGPAVNAIWHATAVLPGSDPLNAAIARTVRQHGSRTFLEPFGSGTSLTFAGFAAKAESIWADLESNSIASGNVVALISDNSVDLACAMLAILTHGGIAMPLNPKLTTGELKNLLAHSRARLILTETTGDSVADLGLPFLRKRRENRARVGRWNFGKARRRIADLHLRDHGASQRCSIDRDQYRQQCRNRLRGLRPGTKPRQAMPAAALPHLRLH
jgi:ferredoxin